MAFELVRPDSEQRIPEKDARPKLFFAGPIQGSGNWDEKLASELSSLDVVAYDPRRLSMNGFSYEDQVAWEGKWLNLADIITFTFWPEEEKVPGRSYAQTSRFELGEALARAKAGQRGQKVIVYCPEDFPGASYFRYKVTREYPSIARIYSDWSLYVRGIRAAIPVSRF